MLQSNFSYDPFLELNTGIWNVTPFQTGSAAISNDAGFPCLKLSTGTTGSSDITVKTVNSQWGSAKWRMSMRLRVSTKSYLQHSWGAINTNQAILFAIVHPTDALGVIRAYTANGAGSTTTVNITGIDATIYHIYTFERVSSDKVNYYIDGVLKATITTTVPTAYMHYYFYLKNTEAANKDAFIRQILAQEIL